MCTELGPYWVPRKTAFSSAMATKILGNYSYGFENECKEIHESWGRLNQLVLLFASWSKLERQQIRETYKAMYGEDIANLLQKLQVSNIGAKLWGTLSMWMIDQHERDAILAREALEEGDTNYKVLVEILVGRKSSHFMLIRQAYQARFGRRLNQDILNLEPPNPYQKILVALAASHTAHHADVSQHIANCDAIRLHATGEGGSKAIEEAVALEILSKRSIPQMKLTFSSYKRIYGHEYSKSLKNRNCMEFGNALRMVIKCMCNPFNYYAKALYVRMKGTTTDKGALTRIMVGRAEVDLHEIQRVFKQKYAVELKDAICESTPSGEYGDFLVALATKTTSTSQ